MATVGLEPSSLSGFIPKGKRGCYGKCMLISSRKHSLIPPSNMTTPLRPHNNMSGTGYGRTQGKQDFEFPTLLRTQEYLSKVEPESGGQFQNPHPRVYNPEYRLLVSSWPAVWQSCGASQIPIKGPHGSYRGADQGEDMESPSSGRSSVGNSISILSCYFRDVFNHAAERKSLASLFKFLLSPVFILAAN